jgi:hypothetical protein
MKLCFRCKLSKPYDLFPKNTASKDGLLNSCKECANEYHRNSYRKNKDQGNYYIRSKQWAEQRRDLNRQFLWEYKESHPCVDCGEKDPRVLQFDHVRGDKKAGLSELAYSKKVNIEKLCEEIKKCEVRCSNCHLKRTWDSRNYTIPIRKNLNE